MRNKAVFALCLLVLILPARRAAAVEPVPGNSCTGIPGIITNSFQWAGGPENSGVTNGMFCNGSTWQSVINFQNTGRVAVGQTSSVVRLDVNGTIRFGYGGETCDSSHLGGLYYSSATHLMYGCLTGSGWTQLATGSGSGSPTDFSAGSSGTVGSAALAGTPGFVTAYATRNSGTCTLTGLTDGSNPPLTTVVKEATPTASDTVAISFPVKNGNYYEVTQANCTSASMLFTPLSGYGFTATTSWPAGTAAAPGWPLSTDSTTGLYEYTGYGPAIGITSGGAQVVGFDPGSASVPVNYFVYTASSVTSGSTSVSLSAAGANPDIDIRFFSKGSQNILMCCSGVVAQNTYSISGQPNSGNFNSDFGSSVSGVNYVYLQNSNSTSSISNDIVFANGSTALWELMNDPTKNASDTFALYHDATSTYSLWIDSSDRVGIGWSGTPTLQATLDVNGYMRLKKYSAQPVACSATYDGAVALTHVYTLCICNGGSSAWKQSKDGTTACSW